MTEDSYNFEPEEKGISHHVSSGIANSGLIQIIKIICQFSSIAILSRLLPPADFGLMAMVTPVYGFIVIFHDLGLSQAIMHKHGLKHEEVNAFFWLNIVIGIVLAGFTIMVSPLVGWYYKDERTISLTVALAALILIGSVGNQHGVILLRRMQFSKLAIIDATGTISGMLVSIIMTFLLRSYWGLYFGMATAILVPVVGVWIACAWKPSTPRLVPNMRDMFKFGAGLTSFNFTSFIAGNMDNILIGRKWGELELGFYDRAYKLLLFPIQRITAPLSVTMVPLLSRIRDDVEQYRSVIYNTQEQLLLAVWPGILWAILLSNTVIPTVLGKNWQDTIFIFVPLGVASLAQIFNSPTNWIFMSQGRGSDFARWGFISAVTSVAAFIIGLPYGAWGVAVAYAVSEYIRTPILWWYTARNGVVSLRSIASITLPHVLSAAATSTVLFIFQANILGPALLILLTGLLLSYSTFVITMLLFKSGRKTLRQTCIFISQFLSHLNIRRPQT